MGQLQRENKSFNSQISKLRKKLKQFETKQEQLQLEIAKKSSTIDQYKFILQQENHLLQEFKVTHNKQSETYKRNEIWLHNSKNTQSIIPRNGVSQQQGTIR